MNIFCFLSISIIIIKMKANILFINTTIKIAKHFFCTKISNRLPFALKTQNYLRFHQIQLNDNKALSILKTMASKQFNKNLLISHIQNYLQRQAVRTPKGLISVIWAINQCEDLQVRSYCRHFIEYVLRSEDMSVYICDKYQLLAILTQLSLKRSQAYEKIKQSMIKYKTGQLIMVNKQVVCPLHFHQIIFLLTSTDRMIVTTNSRFLSLAQILNNKILAYLKLYVSGKMIVGDQRFITPIFINNLMYYFRQYPPQQPEAPQLLLQFLAKAVFQKNRQFKKILLYNAHRCFPYWTKTQNGQYYKDIVLKRIIQRQTKNLDVGQDWNEGLFCYSILSFQFYKAIDQVQFRYDGQLNYLLKEDIHIPKLPSIFWQKYKKSPSLVNKDHIARNIIKKVYADKYVSTPQVQSSTIKPAKVTQNQVKVRIELALQKLKLQSKKEVEINGRYVDFLIDDIVIQCDGDHHFDLYRMDYDESTQFRNLHLLLAGYRLLVINIFQYNHHRKTQALAQLISNKLAVMNKHKAVMIL